MKKLNDVFELPVSGQDVSEFYYLDCSDEEDDDAIAHAINHIDTLADALEALTSDIESNNNPRYSFECAIAALAAYRGEA
jgi:hypothetical protein